MTRITVQAAGARLSAQVDGDEEKPWLLLSNSLAADLTMWDDQIGLFTQTHRVVRYDTRGHGQSEAPVGAYDFPMLVADMAAVLDAVGAAKADICGLSLGGMTALGLGLAHPGRVGRMLVCDARADAPDVVLDDAHAPGIARLAQALKDLLGAERMGIEPTDDTALEGVELTGAGHGGARGIGAGAPAAHGLDVQPQIPGHLAHTQVFGQAIADRAPGRVVDHPKKSSRSPSRAVSSPRPGIRGGEIPAMPGPVIPAAGAIPGR